MNARMSDAFMLGFVKGTLELAVPKVVVIPVPEPAHRTSTCDRMLGASMQLTSSRMYKRTQALSVAVSTATMAST